MNRIYNKVLSQNGLADFKTLVEKWEILSENLLDKPSGVPIILPDLFLVSRSGTGRTHFLRLLSEYLEGKPNLMDFYGDVKCFEFMLNYCAPDEFFSEIQRFVAESNSAAGFRSEYRGIVYIDVDEWRISNSIGINVVVYMRFNRTILFNKVRTGGAMSFS